MKQEQWDELKRLHAKLPCERLTFGTEQICELNASGGYSPIAERVSAREVDQFMAYMQFFTTFHNAFPQILAECDAAQNALNEAAYALFQIKRMTPEAIPQFAADAHAKACKHLDNFPTFDKESKND